MKLFRLCAQTPSELIDKLERAVKNDMSGQQTLEPCPYALSLFYHNKESLHDQLTTELRVIQNIYEDQWHEQRSQSKKLCLVFTGQGSTFQGMFESINQCQPLYQTLREYSRTFLNHGINIQSFIDNQDTNQDITNTLFSQACIAALGLCMNQVYREAGVIADDLIGHSIGEYLTYHSAGYMDEKTCLSLVSERAKQMSQSKQSAQGYMLACCIDVNNLEKKLGSSKLWQTIDIAGINSPKQTILSITEEHLQDLKESLKSEKIVFTQLPVSDAFHSRQMTPAAEGFLTFLKQYKPEIKNLNNKQTQRIISNLSGTVMTESITPKYLAEHITKPVLFMPSIMACLDQGVRNFVEIGPRMLLSQSIRLIGQAYGLDKNELNLIQGYKADNNHHPLDSLTQLEKLGYCIDWVNLHKLGYFNLEP